MENKCPACSSVRIVEGKIHEDEGMTPSFQLPPQGEGFWRTFGPTVKIERSAGLCVDCGLVWTYVDKAAAINKLSRRGNDETLDRLHIEKRPKRKWLWRLLGIR